jgi:hypothetical protein
VTRAQVRTTPEGTIPEETTPGGATPEETTPEETTPEEITLAAIIPGGTAMELVVRRQVRHPV